MNTVAVLLPTFNQARFLPRALAGLASQTFRDFDLIACDDGSTDGTADILSVRGIRTVTHQDNRGTAAAINSAAALAGESKLITWVSSDNVMDRDWLKVLVEFTEARPDCGAVYSAYVRCEDGKRVEVRPGAYDPARLVSSENCYFGPSFLVRRDLWPEQRGLASHDYQSWTVIEEACWTAGLTISYIDRPLCDYHAGDWNTARRRPELYDATRWRAEATERRAWQARGGPDKMTA